MIRSFYFLSLTLFAACASDPPLFERRLDEWSTTEIAPEDAREADRPEPADLDGLDSLLHRARVANPGVQAAYQRWRRALERVPQATTLPEPKLSLAAYLAEVETRVGPMLGRVGVTQAFPWFGTLDAAGEAAFQESEAAREAFVGERLEVLAQVRGAWFELAWLERALAITRGHQELLAHWESVARSKLETGIGSHADVIRTQVELGKLEDRLRGLEDLRRPLRARLAAGVGLPTDAPLPVPSYPLPEPRPFDEERLLEELPATSPVLRRLEFQIESAKQKQVVAGKARYPDFQVGVDYTLIGSAGSPGVRGSGDDAVALTLGFSLPFRTRSYDAAEREAEAGWRAARREHQGALDRLAADVEASLYRLRDADRRLELYAKSLVPKGEESVEASDTAYQTGEGAFLDLIDAQRGLLEFELEAARAEADRAQALAELERLTGAPLNTEIQG